MPRQIYFFMDNIDRNEFHIFIKENNYKVYDVNTKELTDFNQNIDQFFIALDPFNLKLFSGGFINEIDSDVVEYDSCSIENDLIKSGRLCLFTSYYEDGLKIIKKGTVIQIYNKLSKYIKNKYKISIDKQYYAGPGAYTKYLKGWYLGSRKNPIIF